MAQMTFDQLKKELEAGGRLVVREGEDWQEVELRRAGAARDVIPDDDPAERGAPGGEAPDPEGEEWAERREFLQQCHLRREEVDKAPEKWREAMAAEPAGVELDREAEAYLAQLKNECPDCGGSRVCQRCGGSGYDPEGAPGDPCMLCAGDALCPICTDQNRCPYCGGQGEAFEAETLDGEIVYPMPDHWECQSCWRPFLVSDALTLAEVMQLFPERDNDPPASDQPGQE